VVADTGSSRLVAARRRSLEAKGAIGILGVAAFGVFLVAARAQAPGHHRRSPRPLAAPESFVRVVRQNLLEAGIIAPAEAPPDAQTAVS